VLSSKSGEEINEESILEDNKISMYWFYNERKNIKNWSWWLINLVIKLIYLLFLQIFIYKLLIQKCLTNKF